MPSSDDEEVEDVAPDAFTPVKTAVRDLQEECWSPPVRTSRTACAGRYAASKDLLEACGIALTTPIKELKSLAQAVTEIAVVCEEGGSEKVPKDLDFLFKLETCGAKVICGCLARLCEIARITEVEHANIGKKRMSGVNRVVFVRAVAARALDALVIAEAKGSGLKNEWAGALWVVSYEGGKPVPKHTTDFLKTHQEWVFGDYVVDKWPQLQRRLVQRQLHRLVAHLCERPLTQSEIKAWSKDGKAKRDWVTSSKGFKARVEDVIRLSKAAVTPRPNKKARTDDRSGAETSDGGVTEAPDSSGDESRAETSDGGVTDALSGSDAENSDVRLTANTKSGFAFTAVEVADWLAKRVDGFMQFADKWTITGRMVQDYKLAALKRAVEGVGMGMALSTVVVEELAAIGDAALVIPASSFRSRSRVASTAAVVAPNLKDLKFGLGPRRVSAAQLLNSWQLAIYWCDLRVLWLDRGVESKGTIVSACQDFKFTIQPDRLAERHCLLRWSVQQTVMGLRDLQDLQQVVAHEEGEKGGAAQELEGRASAKKAIKDLNTATANEILDDAYERMNAEGRFDGLGFGANGFLDGKSARVVWDELAAGGASYAKVVGHKAFQRVINKLIETAGARDVRLTQEQAMKAAFPMGGKAALTSLTCFNPSAKQRGVTADHVTSKQVLRKLDGGELKAEDVEVDHRVVKSWNSFVYTKAGLRRFFEVMEVAHSKTLARMWMNDLDDRIEDLLNECGDDLSIDPLDEFLTLVWRELPLKFVDAIAASERSGTKLCDEFAKLDWAPDDWKTKKDRIIMKSMLKEFHSLKAEAKSWGKKRGAGQVNRGSSSNNGGSSQSQQEGLSRRQRKRQKQRESAATKTGAVTGTNVAEDRRKGGLRSDRDPGWDRFDPEVKAWCTSNGFGSVHAARQDWSGVETNKGKCFWTNSELGKLMGGECKRGDQCHYKESHGYG